MTIAPVVPYPLASSMDTTLAMSDRKSTRLNSSHSQISYAVFCLKKQNDVSREGLPPRKLPHYRAVSWALLILLCSEPNSVRSEPLARMRAVRRHNALLRLAALGV